MGTVGYMSPEQVRGQPSDGRSDIFALGCVLHEMLTGKIAFARESTADTQAAILKDEPLSLSESDVALPAELERTVRRCLEKNLQARFQSASDLAYNLRSISAVPTMEQQKRPNWQVMAAAATVGFAAVSAFWVSQSLKPKDSRPSAEIPRIAVLPFENVGPAENEYFVDGMTDEVRGKLSRLTGLEVIARDSSEHYKQTTLTPTQIADELGVRYLLTARLRWQESEDGQRKMRLSSELVNVSAGKAPVAIWQESLDASVTDVFEVQTKIAQQVATRLDIILGAAERNDLIRTPTSNLSAYEAYLQAKQLRGRQLTAHHKEELLQLAVKIDPGFALAWAALSVTQTDIFWYLEQTSTRAELPRMSAKRALDLNPTLPEARYAMAWYLLWVASDNDGAKSQVDVGLEVAPNSPSMLLASARVNRRDPDRWGEALANCRRAVVLDPTSESAVRMLGMNLLFMRRLNEAEEALDRALSISPGNFSAIRNRVMVELARGNLGPARAIIRRALNYVNEAEFLSYMAVLDDMYWVLDAEQQNLLLELGPEVWGTDQSDRALAMAHIHHLRGEQGLASEWAAQASQELTRSLAEFPERSGLNAMMGVSLAYQGKGPEAVEFGRNAIRLYESKRTSEYPGEQLQLVRIHLLLGQYDAAIDQLEPLLEVPMFLTPGWLSIDPMFDPLRGHPRFRALIESPTVQL
jgi:TolB-like protein